MSEPIPTMNTVPELVPVIRQDNFEENPVLVEKSEMNPKPKSKTTRKRCKKGTRRNKKTHRCNKKCPVGYKKNAKTKHCIRKK